MKPEVRKCARPISVDVGHIHPRSERLGKGVQQALGWFVYLGNAQYVVNVGDDPQPCRRDKIASRVPIYVSLGVDIQALDLVCRVAGIQPGVIDLDEAVIVSFCIGWNWVIDTLTPTIWSYGPPSTFFSGGSCSRCRLEVECKILVALLEYEDFSSQISSLRCL